MCGLSAAGLLRFLTPVVKIWKDPIVGAAPPPRVARSKQKQLPKRIVQRRQTVAVMPEKAKPVQARRHSSTKLLETAMTIPQQQNVQPQKIDKRRRTIAEFCQKPEKIKERQLSSLTVQSVKKTQ